MHTKDNMNIKKTHLISITTSFQQNKYSNTFAVTKIIFSIVLYYNKLLGEDSLFMKTFNKKFLDIINFEQTTTLIYLCILYY